jgi:hypothetical protein
MMVSVLNFRTFVIDMFFETKEPVPSEELNAYQAPAQGAHLPASALSLNPRRKTLQSPPSELRRQCRGT